MDIRTRPVGTGLKPRGGRPPHLKAGVRLICTFKRHGLRKPVEPGPIEHIAPETINRGVLRRRLRQSEFAQHLRRRIERIDIARSQLLGIVIVNDRRCLRDVALLRALPLRERRSDSSGSDGCRGTFEEGSALHVRYISGGSCRGLDVHNADAWLRRAHGVNSARAAINTSR